MIISVEDGLVTTAPPLGTVRVCNEKKSKDWLFCSEITMIRFQKRLKDGPPRVSISTPSNNMTTHDASKVNKQRPINMMERRRSTYFISWLQLIICSSCIQSAYLWIPPLQPRLASKLLASKTESETSLDVFREFVDTLQQKQAEIIQELEEMDGSSAKFTNDTWGCFAGEPSASGGITRVLQGGNVIEKGACSFTLIQQGVLSSERASAIRSRQGAKDIQAGDTYSAAALSIVLHTRSPMIPTFRSDVRIFLVENSKGFSLAWFGGGADLTPYYLFEDDITDFHCMYRDLCNQYKHAIPGYSYETMKTACDEYFYLPARSEHRGTGGIFFDDLEATPESSKFVQAVADTWLPSWLPIIARHRKTRYSDKQRQWQLLRRGRYLEFNLLYDRGVKFGLASANPRVEGVMVSAPPLIAWEYNHEIAKGSDEARMMQVLKEPKSWV